jgi:hypothetical protein
VRLSDLRPFATDDELRLALLALGMPPHLSGRPGTVGVAITPWNRLDLAFVDFVLASSSRAVEVVVLTWRTQDELEQQLPGVGVVFQSPVVRVVDAAGVGRVAWGAQGRQWVVEELGLPPFAPTSS